jgi:hypothetical protein
MWLFCVSALYVAISAGPGTSAAGSGQAASSGGVAGPDLRVVRLALSTLGTFNFQGIQLLPFVRECVVRTSTLSPPRVRARVCVCCVRVVCVCMCAMCGWYGVCRSVSCPTTIRRSVRRLRSRAPTC